MFDYWKTAQSDIINYMMAGFQAKDCYIRKDNKIALITRPAYTSPWVNAKVATDRNCPRYQGVYHSIFGFIPTKCMGCWKVVARPRNLIELFEVLEYQKELRLPSKSGMEIRITVSGNYGSYWYTNSQEEGLDLLDTVRKDFPKADAVLKRGCTEFELSHGRSDLWEHTAHSQAMEEFLEATLMEVTWDGKPVELSGKNSPQYVIDHTKRRWIEFAYDRGDQSYKYYTKGHPIFPTTVKYEKAIEDGCQVTNLIQLS
jgi:hypothetical protein